MNAPLSADRVRELLSYDEVTGAFLWRCRVATNIRVGSTAGRLSHKGYREIGIDGRLWSAHRLAWLHVHGEWPNGMLDHINGVKDDNRIANLRVVGPAENAENKHRAQGANPHIGVSWQASRAKWRADICVRGRRITIGRFDTVAEAAAAYRGAKARWHIAGALIDAEHPWPAKAEAA